MAPPNIASNEQLIAARDACRAKSVNGVVRSWQVKDELAKHGIYMDESTIRGRFIQIGEPLGTLQTALATPNVELKVANGAADGTADGSEAKEEATKAQDPVAVPVAVPEQPEAPVEYPEGLKAYIPTEKDVAGYIERDIDERLEMHYKLGKHPITQGKQGTGKTFSHLYYAFKKKVPFMLISCYEDMKLIKFFGDKTIKDGTVVFKEGIFTKMIQYPCVILFDEFNYITNAGSVDFHALIQNRELFIKDAADGVGKTYKLNPKCRIGFAQNPRSAKYVGGVIKPSSFLGRCTYLSFPDFQKDEILSLLNKRFPKMTKDILMEFVDFFFEANNFMISNGIAVDISIRQLLNMVDFYQSGMKLEDAIEDGLVNILDAVSQPQHKKALAQIAKTIFTIFNTKEDAPGEEKLNKMKTEILTALKAGAITKTQAENLMTAAQQLQQQP